MATTFQAFFRAATDGKDPYPFQERFAEADGWPHLLRAPTGAGKTATAILGWLWRRKTKESNTPRRLVYCLPMRVLVEQSVGEASKWLNALYDSGELDEKLGRIAVHQLMGGVDGDDWHLHPERPAILIGTQDMLLSRALNRGYGARSRFHWPIEFGLLNNDCLWVFDEPQLMGSGVATSAQLAGLRRDLETFGSCPSIWMSATLEPHWLDTIDFRGKFPGAPFELTDEDYDPKRPLHKRMTAEKLLAPLGVTITKEADEKEARDVAAAVREKHQAGTQTLVVLNTVKRAKAVYLALLKAKHPAAKLLLVHSRFRPAERKALNTQLRETGEATKDRILVATQVVEAGVDISSRTLVTELAPWSSVVQRIGRCNRTGDDGPGQVFWIDLDLSKDVVRLPYEADDLEFAREQLEKLDGKGVSPKALEDFKKTSGMPPLPFEHVHVLQRRDLIDLFDTSPDLSGNVIDVSQYVRGDDPDTDVQVFWRDLDTEGWDDDPTRRELCNVPVGQARDFLKLLAEKKRGAGFVWDHLSNRWVKLDWRQVRPGLTILLPVEAGGYSSTMGWNPDSTEPVTPLPPKPEEARRPEAAGSDPNNETPNLARTLVQHTDKVCEAVAEIVDALDWLTEEERDHLKTAARWHDVGKGHPVFQGAVRRVNPDLPEGDLWAKTGRNGKLDYGSLNRPHFRHELASALAALQHHPEWPPIVAYLIAAHHGRVRLSMRALPGEEFPDDERKALVIKELDREPLYALGVWDLDPLPDIPLGDDTVCPAIALDLSPMTLGGGWTENALALRDRLGPFRLAMLEAILRAADQRVSNAERKEGQP